MSPLLVALACGSNVEVDDSGDASSSGAASSSGVQQTTASPTADVSTTSTSTTGEVGLTDGVYLLAVSAVIAPDLPLQYLAGVSTAGREMSIELTPLSLEPGSLLEPRLPIPEFITTHDGIAVADGEFLLELRQHMVPGTANPITGGDIVFDGRFDANTPSSTMFCGTLSGEISAPITANLEGSTFAAILIEDDAPLPVDFPLGC